MTKYQHVNAYSVVGVFEDHSTDIHIHTYVSTYVNAVCLVDTRVSCGWVTRAVFSLNINAPLSGEVMSVRSLQRVLYDQLT